MIKNIIKEILISISSSYFISIIFGLLLMAILMIASALNAVFSFLGETVLSVLFIVFLLAFFVGAMYLNNYLSYEYAYKKTFNGKFNEKEQKIALCIALVLQIALLFLTLGNSAILSWIVSMSSFYSLGFCGIASMIFGTEYIGLFVGSVFGTVIFYIVRYFSLLEGYRYVLSRSESLLLEKKKAAIEKLFSGETNSKSWRDSIK